MSFNYLTVIEIKRKFPNVKVYIHLHSKFPFLATENNAVTYIQKCLNNGVEIIFNHRSALMSFPVKGCHYLPNVYSFKISNTENNVVRNENELNIGCHGSMRHMKNQIIQAVAACRLAKDLNKKLIFHVNSSRDDGEKSSILSSIDQIVSMNGGQLAHSPWLEHSNFISYVKNLDLGMQVSLCETFNLVAADYVTAGIPLVVSAQIS